MAASPSGSSRPPSAVRRAASIRSPIDSEQATDPLRRKLQDAAVLQASDQLAIDDLRRLDAATIEQARQDRQQRDARAIHLDTEIEREFEPPGASSTRTS